MLTQYLCFRKFLNAMVAVKIVVGKNVHKQKSVIFSDSQALNSNVMSSRRMALNCCRCRNEVAYRYDACMIWVPEYKAFPVTAERMNMTIELSVKLSVLWLLLDACKLVIDNAIVVNS